MHIKNLRKLIAVLSVAVGLTSQLSHAQSVSDITDLILVTGQSNVRGSQTDYDPALDSVDLRVFAYTDTNDWEVADLHQAWDVDGWHPGNGSLTDSTRSPYNNFAFHFAKTVVENDPSRVVGFVIASAPGEGIQHWDANSQFSQTIETKVLAALSAQGVKSKIDGIIWHQGETDWQYNGTSDIDATDAERADPTYYPDKLNALISRYRSENWFDAGKPFICGETRQAPVNDRLLALNSDNDPWTGCVAGRDLPTREQDLQATPPKLGTHFNASALRQLGQRYGEKYLEMTGTSPILPKTNTLKIMAVGDSITEGVLGQKSYRNELVPPTAATGCSFEMVGSKLNNETPTGFQSPHEGYSGHPANRFIPGQTSGGNPGIDVMMSQSPDVVLLHLGSNDIRLAQSVSGTVNEIDQIVTRIWANNSVAEVFVANVIPWYGTSSTNSNVQSDIQQLGTAIETWVTNKADSRLHLVDVRSQYNPNMMISDLIHPNAVGEAHIADAFLSALDIAFPNTDFSCGAPTVDLIAPETFIAVPAAGSNVAGTTTYSGSATDTGGSGFDRVQIASRDDNANNWYNFTNGTFGAISQGGVEVGITNATLSNTTTVSTNWSISVTLPVGDYTFFALAVDNAGNDAFHGAGLSVWPVNTNFTVAPPALCNGLPVSVDLNNGDSPTSGADVIMGTPGNDIIIAMGGDDTICSMGGDDELHGGSGNDIIFGGHGNDRLWGGSGDDTLHGEAGDDILRGNNGNDTLHGNEGADTTIGQSGNDTIHTGSGANIASGGSGNDIIFGGNGDDLIRGHTGIDTITGGPGDDRLFGGGGEDNIDGGEGNDLLRGNGDADIIMGGSGDDDIGGSDGNDTIYGGPGNDDITGATGNDIIFGESGNDTLHGGGGNDALDGGANNDICDGAGGSIDTASACETEYNVP